MLLAFVIGGTISFFLAIGIYIMIHFIGIDSETIGSIFGSFAIIGPVEEFSKLVGLIVAYQFIKRQMNEITDGVIYISCVALGFSIIENFLYANSGRNNEYLLIFRALISTPAHISFSCLIGYAFYRYKKENKPYTIMVWALIISSLLHGVFDAIIFSDYFRYFLIFYLFIIFGQLLRIIQLTNIISPFKPVFLDFFNTPSDDDVEIIECPYCKSTDHKKHYKNFYFTAYKCEPCGYYISSIKDIKRIFKYFAPEYKDLNKETYPVEFKNGQIYSSIYAVTFFHKDSNFGFYNIENVELKLRIINDSIIDKFYRSKIIPTKYLAKIMD